MNAFKCLLTMNPIVLKLNSVAEQIINPAMMGKRDATRRKVVFSLRMSQAKSTVTIGADALTVSVKLAASRDRLTSFKATVLPRRRPR